MFKIYFQRYFSDSFFLNFPLIINTLIALITLPIVLSNLPIHDYGKFQLILAIQVWLSAFSAVNITSASKRGLAQGLNGTFLYAFFARFKILIIAATFALGASVYLGIIGLNVFSSLAAIMGVYLVSGLLFQTSFYEFLIAKKRFKERCFWQVLIFTISMVGAAATAAFTKKIIYFALFQLGSVSFISCAAWFWIVRKESLVESYKKDEIDRECVPYGIKLLPVDLISITADKLSHFIIGLFYGFGNLTIFSVADKLREKFAGVIKSMRPLLYSDFALMEKSVLKSMINRHLVKIGAVGVGGAALFMCISWFYITYFLPLELHKAIIYFSILASGLPASMMAILLHTVLESHLRYKELTLIGIISSLSKISLIIIISYFWQITGICVALSISRWVSFGFYYFFTIKKQLA